MIKKRTILIIGIIAVSIICIGPLGWSPAFLIVGLVLSVIVGNKGDQVAVRAIQQGRVTVTEIRERANKREPELDTTPTPPQPETVSRFEPEDHNAPTVALNPNDEILEASVDEPEQDFIIGETEDGRAIKLPKITSLGVGGVPGSGKTVAVVGLCTQAVPKYKGNVRLLVIDPHMRSGSEDALSARMAPLAPFYLNVENLPNPVSGGADLLKWIAWFTKQAKDRIGGRADQALKLVVVADEFTALMDDEEICGPLTDLLVMINEQARKVGMFALVASPAWKSSRVQGTDIRNTIASFLVHNMPPNIARQLVPNAAAELANTLDVGQAIFSSFGKIELVRVPYMTHKEVTRIVQPYLPPVSHPLGVSGLVSAYNPVDREPETVVGLVEPGIAEVRKVWETYQMLNTELDYDEAHAITALAIHLYPGDPLGEARVRRALELGEEHL